MSKKTDVIDSINNSEIIKEEMMTLLQDYSDIKREASELGYKEQSLQLKDYMEFYVRLNDSKSK